jgi:hypothetical protein
MFALMRGADWFLSRKTMISTEVHAGMGIAHTGAVVKIAYVKVCHGGQPRACRL